MVKRVLPAVAVLLLCVGVYADEEVQFLGPVQYEVFEGSWPEMPDFDALTPTKTGISGKEGHYWYGRFDMSAGGKPGEFAYRYRGELFVPYGASYSFGFDTSNPCALFIDNTLVGEADKARGSGWQMSDAIRLEAGRHPFTILYLSRKDRGQGLRVFGEPLMYRVNPKHWLYFGWENDYPKSLSFMGGTLAPGRGTKIQYVVDVDGSTHYPDEYAADRRSRIKWYLADKFMPSPVSEWEAGNVGVKIQHFSVRREEKMFLDATVVFTRISLTNNGHQDQTARLNVNAGPMVEVPLTHVPGRSDDRSMAFDVPLAPGETADLDFATEANGLISTADILGLGGFDENYAYMSDHFRERASGLTRPVSLPEPRMVEMYTANQIVMWESIVLLPNGDYEMRASGGNPTGLYQYDRTFSHDVPNMVVQFIKEGDLEVARNIMESKYYQKLGKVLELDYLDAIPKYIIPYATYLQVSGDLDYFTPERRALLKENSRRIHAHREKQLKEELRATGHYGIMDKSNGLDNGHDYMVIDNFAALHGLAAYEWLSKQFGDDKEAAWARAEMEDLNAGLNDALLHGMKRRGVDFYMSNIDDIGGRKASFWQIGYSGNWIGTTLMMPTFPWGAQLKGFDLGGTWKDHFDRTIEHAMKIRNEHPVIPEGSWGAWWGNEYGTVYNAAMGFQTLSSEKYRTLAIKNLEWLLENQTAPYQWGENFDKGFTDDDWTVPAHDYETWGLSFMKQALLEACVSVKTDGTVIIGRGIPNHWLKRGAVIAWEAVRVNDGRILDFSISAMEQSVTLKLEGDDPVGAVLFNLPAFVGNISKVVADGKAVKEFDVTRGIVELPATTREVTVEFVRSLY